MPMASRITTDIASIWYHFHLYDVMICILMTIPVASWTSPCYHDYSHMAIPISMVSHDIMTIYMVPWLCGIFNTIHMVPWLFTWYHDCPHGTMTIYIVSLLSTWYHDYLHGTISIYSIMTIYIVSWLYMVPWLYGTMTIYMVPWLST